MTLALPSSLFADVGIKLCNSIKINFNWSLRFNPITGGTLGNFSQKQYKTIKVLPMVGYEKQILWYLPLLG